MLPAIATVMGKIEPQPKPTIVALTRATPDEVGKANSSRVPKITRIIERVSTCGSEMRCSTMLPNPRAEVRATQNREAPIVANDALARATVEICVTIQLLKPTSAPTYVNSSAANGNKIHQLILVEPIGSEASSRWWICKELCENGMVNNNETTAVKVNARVKLF